jgi:hypothetical protein
MHDVTLRRAYEFLLPWKNNKYHIFVCVCVCVCARMLLPGHMGVYMRVCACSFGYPKCFSYAPYCDVICDLSGSTIFFDVIS